MERRHREPAAEGHEAGGELRFVFAGGSEFRAPPAAAGESLLGFWVEAAGVRTQAMASPLALAAVGHGVWRATVVPLRDNFTLYLKIFHDNNGALAAAFRNPEVNMNGGSSRFAVTRKGDTLNFLSLQSGEVVRSATVLHAPERLRIHWPHWMTISISCTAHLPMFPRSFRGRPARHPMPTGNRRTPATAGSRRAPPTPGWTKGR